MQLETSKVIALAEIFREYPDIEEAILYGSRALGRAKPGSDIDISLKGEIKLQQQLQLMDKIEELYWPIPVDFSIFSQIQNPDLVQHIQTFGISIYKKENKITK